METTLRMPDGRKVHFEADNEEDLQDQIDDYMDRYYPEGDEYFYIP